MTTSVLGLIVRAMLVCAPQPPAEPSPSTTPAQAPTEQTVTNPPQEFPPIVVKSPPKPAPGAGFANADELLVSLEDADKGMTSLTAQIVYNKILATVGDKQTRSGRLYFQNAGVQGRRFAIEFDTFVRGDGTVDNDPCLYVFDGQWLLDKNSREKRFSKKQVVPPGQNFDPLKIGEGPFPIPIGQKREDILSRYNAELLPASDGLDPKDPAQKRLIEFVTRTKSVQLRLVPRPDRPDQDRFKEIRLWYAPEKDGGRLLPCMARTIAVGTEPGENGNESIVRLIDVKLNGAIPPGVLDTSTPPAAEGWDGVVTDFREPAGK